MTDIQPQQQTVGPWIYTKSADVLAAVRLRPVATYICRRRHHITTTIEGRALLEECRGAERRSGSSSRLIWWQQEMNLEEDDDRADSGGRGGVFPRRFYNKAGNEVGDQRVINPDPCKCFMDCPNKAPDNFARRYDLEW